MALKTGNQAEIDGVEYRVDEFGIIRQVIDDGFVPFTYDIQYVKDRYGSYGPLVRQMSMLRAGFVSGVCGRINSVVDVGYGNGDFLAVMHAMGAQCHGIDVTGYPLPEGCNIGKPESIAWDVDLMTWFDSLEHLPATDFLGDVQARHIAITAPFCHAIRLWWEWFRGWKHRRHGEHLLHFSPESLENLMHHYGYREIIRSNIEDVIRRPTESRANTLTSVFSR